MGLPPKERQNTMYVVIYSSAGCLPDSDEPEFEGTLDECAMWIVDNAQDYLRPETDHDLYGLQIIPV